MRTSFNASFTVAVVATIVLFTVAPALRDASFAATSSCGWTATPRTSFSPERASPSDYRICLVELERKEGGLSGRVVYVDGGAPAQANDITLRLIDEGSEVYAHQGGIETSADGRFRFEQVPNGRVQLQFRYVPYGCPEPSEDLHINCGMSRVLGQINVRLASTRAELATPCADDITSEPSATEERGPAGVPYSLVAKKPKLIGGREALDEQLAYPDSARRASIEGTVFLQFIVGTDGQISNVSVLRSPHASLSQEAIRALRAGRFEPGRQDGSPVPVRMSLPVRFEKAGAGADVIE